MFGAGAMRYRWGALPQRTEQGTVQHLEEPRRSFGLRHATHRKLLSIKEAGWRTSRSMVESLALRRTGRLQRRKKVIAVLVSLTDIPGLQSFSLSLL